MLRKTTSGSTFTFSGTLTAPSTTAVVFTSDAANSGTNAAFTFNNTTALSGTTLLARFGSNGSYKVHIEDDGTFVPVVSEGPALGKSGAAWGSVSTSTYNDNGANNRLLFQGGSSGNVYIGRIANSGTNCAHTFNNTNALSGTTKLAAFQSNSVEKCFIDDDGQLENATAGMGVILKSPDGTRYRLTIANGGTVSVGAA